MQQTRNLRSGKVLPILFLLLAIGGSVGFGWWYLNGGKSKSNSTAPVLHTVTSGPFDHIVLEQGEIESSNKVEVKCEVKGKGTSGTPILWVIDEGSYVKKGDELVKLDSSALESDMKSQRITVSSADANVISSDAMVQQAIIARQEYLEGTYLTERKAILSEIAVAEQDVRKAELSLASAERLAAKGSLKSLQIEAEQFAVQNSRNKLEAAQGRLRVLDELTKEKMLVQFNSDIETKRAKLESDKKTANEELSKLKEFEQQITACILRSPTDGQVVHANKMSARGGSSEFVVEAGAMVREQQTIIILPDPTQMQVKAKINESRITLVRDGMAAKIKVSAVPGDLLGQVIKVNKYAEAGNWFSSAVKEYATYIQIKNPPETIRTGMTAEVRIFVEQIENAIQVPMLGVYEAKGHHFVLLKKGEAWETKEVEIGATNDKFVTVKDGINDGDQVVLNPKNHLALMKIPEFEEAQDREQLAAIAKEIPVKSNNKGKDGPGGPGAGGPAAGGVAGMVDMAIQRSDTDSDGKISKAEAEGNEMLKKGFDDTDTNKDGFVDKAEMTAVMKKFMPRAGGPGGPGGPGAGPGSGGGGSRP